MVYSILLTIFHKATLLPTLFLLCRVYRRLHAFSKSVSIPNVVINDQISLLYYLEIPVLPLKWILYGTLNVLYVKLMM